MKREGRQHGMVRTFHVLPAPLNPRPPCRIVNRVDSPPTAGIFAKVSHKPTNHSKFTGKCDRPNCSACHIHAGCKSKDKAKGAHKLRSSDAKLNYKVITWKVMGDRDQSFGKMPVSGYSASRMLDELANDDHGDGEYYDDDDYDDEYHDVDDHVDVNDHVYEEVPEPLLLSDNNATDDYVGQTDHDVGHVDVDDEDDYMGFYDVTVVWDPVDVDEGWSLVGGM